MYHSPASTYLLCFIVLATLLLGAAREGYGQRVYATNYGAAQSGPGVLGIISAGLVNSPTNAVEPNSTNGNSAELVIGGLLGNAYAHLQLKFINGSQNLPAGTTIYVRIDGSTSGGLLGLLLASSGFVSAQQNASSGNVNSQGNLSAITGQNIAVGSIQSETIGGNLYLKITPSACFNAITISITTAGLLGLLSNANLKVYHAYYECPGISMPNPTPICQGESTTVQVNNPASCGTYNWYTQATGGTAFHTGTSYTTPALSSTVTYYVEYSGVDNSKCGRTPVTVTVHPKPAMPHITAN